MIKVDANQIGMMEFFGITEPQARNVIVKSKDEINAYIDWLRIQFEAYELAVCGGDPNADDLYPYVDKVKVLAPLIQASQNVQEQAWGLYYGMCKVNEFTDFIDAKAKQLIIKNVLDKAQGETQNEAQAAHFFGKPIKD